MKNRVNLYHPEFHPKLRLLTLSMVICIWLIALVCCIVAYFYLTTEQQNIESEIAAVEKNKWQQQDLVEELQKALDSLKVDPKLLAKVDKNQKVIDLKKHVLNELAGQEQRKSSSYSTLMLDLATHNQKGIWLKQISLNGAEVVMQGAASDSAVVPKWLSSLGKTDYFKGQEFAETRLYRDADKQINFVISTDDKEAESIGNGNE